jgi:hypothetical protein
VAFYSEKHTKHIYTLSGKDTENLYIKVSGPYRECELNG